jgi:thiamine biosynthesis protein ThiS
MIVLVNGYEFQVPPKSTITRLIVELGLAPGQVAVERNLDRVPKSAFETTHLTAGDRIEVVIRAGGGE